MAVFCPHILNLDVPDADGIFIPIESFTFAKSSRFLNNYAPALINQVREKRKLFGDPSGSWGSVKTWAAAHTFYEGKSNFSLRRQRGSIGTTGVMRPDERKAFVSREPHKTDSGELRQIQMKMSEHVQPPRPNCHSVF